ncbi:unnamed protein product, partial [Vitis vinifera]
MGKTGKWIRNFLTGKKDKERDREKDKEKLNSIAIENPSTPILIPPTTPKEKRRWSFRRSSATSAGHKDSISVDTIATTPPAGQPILDSENEQKKHAMAVAAATAAAAGAAVAAAQAAAAVIRLTAAATGRAGAIEEAAAVKIQAAFRAHLARKALCALKGLVKLQALVRGNLVRKQATATLRCMQALVTVQARARVQRIRMTEETKPVNQRQLTQRKSTQDNRFRNTNHDKDRGMEENIKIVEMDQGESKGNNQQISPAPSALTDMSPRACSGHFEEYCFTTTQSSPQCYSAVSKPDCTGLPFAFPQTDCAESLSYDYPFFPNYMANTESSKAKVRSHSAPKQRPESFERQPSRRRASMEGRNIPRAMRMQRSSSHVGSTAQGYQYPWSIKLDRSTVSLKDSECGSTSTVLTNTNYCKSLFAYDLQGDRY